MVVLDSMEKTAGVRILQTELNDSPGVCLKLSGALGDVQSAVAAAENTAQRMNALIVAHVIPSPADGSKAAFEAPLDYNPLIEQPTVQKPESLMKQTQAPFAVGLIE